MAAYRGFGDEANLKEWPASTWAALRSGLLLSVPACNLYYWHDAKSFVLKLEAFSVITNGARLIKSWFSRAVGSRVDTPCSQEAGDTRLCTPRFWSLGRSPCSANQSKGIFRSTSSRSLRRRNIKCRMESSLERRGSTIFLVEIASCSVAACWVGLIKIVPNPMRNQASQAS